MGVSSLPSPGTETDCDIMYNFLVKKFKHKSLFRQNRLEFVEKKIISVLFFKL